MASNQRRNGPGNRVRLQKLDIREHCTCNNDDHPESQESFLFKEEIHSAQVLSGLNNLRQSESFCDVTLCVDGQDFPCHRILLASVSAYFHAMFSGELAESRQDRVSINGVEAAMIELLIGYAYTSEILIARTNVQSLLSAANLLQVLPVRDACCSFMERNMDEANCIGIHCFAETHACPNLQQMAKAYVLQHFQKVSMREEFLGLSQSKLIEFILDDDIWVDSEEQVFEAAMRWYTHNVQDRESDFQEVLKHVRLPLCSPYYLYDCVRTQEVIRQSVECQELVEQATKYHLLPDRRVELRTSRTQPRKAAGIQEVIILVGGEDDKVVLRSVESYDPVSFKWKTLACLPFAVSKHGLVVTGNNLIYMCGGEFPDGSASGSMWRYDPNFDTWQEMASMHTPRSELGLAVLDGYIYAVGGWEGQQRLDSMERYNASTNSWDFMAPMTLAVTSPAVAALFGRLYITGGAVLEDGDGIDLVQCYDPWKNLWAVMSPMLIPRSGSAACAVNSMIYVIGGCMHPLKILTKQKPMIH
ncbi:PREDICTED: kelch-like protein diablo isoform X1 [Priapulus caudatus]|uniref:Kelch-like protein diablo isoform X1 n=1 Tax=Priapulus caudatus TaxID=37621 RepID=A0ABM1F390_PRICU|nr:PREDICTED: kelch-like protein diablo isoform X1 [Priapulus caudatus]